jgi:hypothetical protein
MVRSLPVCDAAESLPRKNDPPSMRVAPGAGRVSTASGSVGGVDPYVVEFVVEPYPFEAVARSATVSTLIN